MIIRISYYLLAIVFATFIHSTQCLLNRIHRFASISGSFSRRVSAPRKPKSIILTANSNPLADMFNRMSGKFKADDSVIDKKIASLDIPTWDEIRSMLEEKQSDEERSFRSNVAKGIGKASPLNLIRLFDEQNKAENIRVTFYRDHASWCPYCQKVWMTLEERRIPYRVEKINMRCYGEKPGSFLRIQPNGLIPVAIIDGKVYNQSNDIMFALETLFPNHKSLTSYETDEERSRAQRLLKLERELFSVWMYWLTGSDSKGGKKSFCDVLNKVESELKVANGGHFFMGKDVSLVDFMFAPFVERMCASLLYYKGFQIRVPPGRATDYPSINKWIDALETLESYRVTKSDYFTHCWDLPPQLGGCTQEVEGKPFANAINGDGTWEFPLAEHLGGLEPDWKWCGDDDAAGREAVERLTFNHAKIVRFAARGAGQSGFPAFTAPLADPNAKPNESVIVPVDSVLRIVSVALLDGTESWESKIATLSTLDLDNKKDIINSLVYLRDRVGVPRDMRLPAARKLRASLNWVISQLN